MPYSRQRPRIAPTGRVSLRLHTGQRDLLVHAPGTPPGLGHALHRAPVRAGKLTLRVGRGELEALIAVAANLRPTDRRTERELDALLRYLESREEQFAEAAEPVSDEPPDQV